MAGGFKDSMSLWMSPRQLGILIHLVEVYDKLDG